MQNLCNLPGTYRNFLHIFENIWHIFEQIILYVHTERLYKFIVIELVSWTRQHSFWNIDQLFFCHARRLLQHPIEIVLPCQLPFNILAKVNFYWRWVGWAEQLFSDYAIRMHRQPIKILNAFQLFILVERLYGVEIQRIQLVSVQNVLHWLQIARLLYLMHVTFQFSLTHFPHVSHNVLRLTVNLHTVWKGYTLKFLGSLVWFRAAIPAKGRLWIWRNIVLTRFHARFHFCQIQ